MYQYYSILMLFAVAGGITAMMYGFSVFFGPKNLSHPLKQLPFECGSKPIGDARIRFPIKFYLVAVSFVIFDLEVVFLYPWAVSFRQLGWFGFWAMMVFLFVLTFGLAYEWKKGGLDWR